MTLQAAQARPADPADDRPPSRQAVLVAGAAGPGYMFDAYVVNIYSFVLPLIAVTFALSTTAQGVIGSVMLLGYAIGTFGFGWAADRFGRRPVVRADLAVPDRRIPHRPGDPRPVPGRAGHGLVTSAP